MMRRIHRWVSFPLIVFLLAVTITGIYLQWLELENELRPRASANLVASLPSDADVTEQIGRALEMAKYHDPAFPTQKIEYTHTGKRKTVKLFTTKRIGPSITVDLVTGDISQEVRPKRTLRTYFVLLHSGKFFGLGGVVLIMLASLVLLILTVTGFVVYLDMYRRRLNAGRKGLFW